MSLLQSSGVECSVANDTHVDGFSLCTEFVKYGQYSAKSMVRLTDLWHKINVSQQCHTKSTVK